MGPEPRRQLLINILSPLIPELPRGSLTSWDSEISDQYIVDAFLKIYDEEILRKIDRSSLLILSRIGSIVKNSISEAKIEEEIEFELAYLQHLENRASRVSTPGVRDLHEVKQDLDIAYLPLEIEIMANKDKPPINLTSAEEIIERFPHLTIKGPAGCGKTTLFNWITLQCAKFGKETSGSIWNNKVPFLIPLRTIANIGEKSPSVKRFVEFSTDPSSFSRKVPDNWIDNILRSGRGIVLIDGLDELPPTSRSVFWDSIRSICENYPECRMYITTRGLPAMKCSKDDPRIIQWAPPSCFAHSKLQSMHSGQINKFITRWHGSINKSNFEDNEIQKIHEASISLQEKLQVSENKRVKELAGTPLLCAMVCVLNWKEEGYLPKQRSELYSRCCDVLIEERDLKRGIQKPQNELATLTKNDKYLTLQNLAFDMMTNQEEGEVFDEEEYRVEIAREKVESWIDIYKGYYREKAARNLDAAGVLDFLLERTGLLREPTTGIIDFTHRSFQEYLAACWAGYKGQEAFLSKFAVDDQWHETIVLAAGTPTGGVPFGEKLIQSLIKKGKRFKSKKSSSIHKRKTYFALALACFDNLRIQSPEIRSIVLNTLPEIIPPSDRDAAKIVSLAGDAAVASLSYEKINSENAEARAASAFTLSLIDTPMARTFLEVGYPDDESPDVCAVLSAYTHIQLKDISYVSKKIEENKSIPTYCSFETLAEVPHQDIIESLRFENIIPADLQNLVHFKKLKQLELYDLKLNSLNKIQLNTEVKFIKIFSCKGDMERLLPKSKKVSRLEIIASIIDKPKKSYLIDELRIIECENIDQIIEFSKHDKLKKLEIKSTQRVRDLQLDTKNFPELRHLSMITRSQYPVIFSPKGGQKLQFLEMSLRGSDLELTHAQAPKLKTLNLKLINANRSKINLENHEGLNRISIDINLSKESKNDCAIYLPPQNKELRIINSQNFDFLNSAIGDLQRLQKLEIFTRRFSWNSPKISQFQNIKELTVFRPMRNLWEILPVFSKLEELTIIDGSAISKSMADNISATGIKKLRVILPKGMSGLAKFAEKSKIKVQAFGIPNQYKNDFEPVECFDSIPEDVLVSEVTSYNFYRFRHLDSIIWSSHNMRLSE